MGFPFFRKSKKHAGSAVLNHLAIIMDGNGRWAKSRGLPRNAGHKAGAETLRHVAEWCGNRGIGILTVYAFSTENWSRPSDEVAALMDLLIEFIKKYEPKMEERGIRLRILGDLESLEASLRNELERVVLKSAGRTNMQLVIAFNYGGRRELLHAVHSIAEKVYEKQIHPDEITEDTIGNNLYLPDIPDPDLIIRPSGELRLSNFLLWQSAYAELWFSNVLWPDFKEKDLDMALAAYSNRERRFGRVKE
jgi:undecaprenyl diphosphate synthase